MSSIRPLAFALALAATATAPVQADDSEPVALSPESAEHVRLIVRELLREHPEIVVDALQEYQRREEAAERERQRATIASLGDQLRHDPNSPVYGNPQGDVTIVEFFDYRCGYCRRVTGPLFDVVREDGNVRWVFKEFPILGEESVLAARAAIAATFQGKYVEFHQALMQGPPSFNEAILMQLAASVGLDVDQLKIDMQDPAVDEMLRTNYQLAEALGVRGTPAFVVNDSFYGGAMSIETLRQVIADARQAAAQAPTASN